MMVLTVSLHYYALKVSIHSQTLSWNWRVDIRLWSANVYEQDMQVSLFAQAFKLEQPHTSAVFLSIISIMRCQSIKKCIAQLHKAA